MPTWSQRLAIGIAEIDDQHRQLFERADALLAAMKERRPTHEVRQLIPFVAEYCQHHFRMEESLMRERGHPGLEAHAAQHAHFTQNFAEIAEAFARKGPSISVTVDLQDLVCRWLVAHIASVDAKLAKASPDAAPPRAEVAASPAPPRPSRLAAAPAAASRFAFVQHRGRQILRLDYAGLATAELLAAFAIAGATIAREPLGSLRILTVLTSPFTGETAEAFKRYALANRPYVLASAVVASTFWRVIVTDLQVHGREDLALFGEEAPAKEWLAAR
ncbi:MAG: bacteriohemerythrin [Anaeromyxobacteraceae bacterium]